MLSARCISVPLKIGETVEVDLASRQTVTIDLRTVPTVPGKKGSTGHQPAERTVNHVARINQKNIVQCCLSRYIPGRLRTSYPSWQASQLLKPFHSSRSNVVLGEHLSCALIQLLRATYFFKARQQIVRP